MEISKYCNQNGIVSLPNYFPSRRKVVWARDYVKSLTENHSACSSHLVTHYQYVRVTERYTETLHMKKMAYLVMVTERYTEALHAKKMADLVMVRKFISHGT